MNKYLRWCAPWLLGLVPVAAFAGDEAAQLATVINSVFDASTAMAGKAGFADMGQMLFRYLLVILISWRGIKLALDISPMQIIIAELVQLILLAGIASMFLQPAFQKEITTGFDTLAGRAVGLAGGAGDFTKPSDVIRVTLGKSMEAIDKLWTAPTKEMAAEKGWSQKVADWFTRLGDTLSPENLMASFAGVLYRALISLCMIIATGLYLATVIMTQISVSIALVMAPLFVPWILWESTASLFHGWLKFLITTGVQKIVGALLFGMTAGMLDKVSDLANQASATPTMNLFAYMAAAIISLIMVMMMTQVHGISNGLVSGHIGTSFKPPQMMTTSGVAGAATSGMNKIAGAAIGAGAASRAGGGMKGMLKGAGEGFGTGAFNSGAPKGGAVFRAMPGGAKKPPPPPAPGGGQQGGNKGKP